MLPLVEFSMNNSENSSTGYSHFYLFNGFEPRWFPSEIARHQGSSIGRKLLRAENWKTPSWPSQMRKSRCATNTTSVIDRGKKSKKETQWLAAEGISWPVDAKRPARHSSGTVLCKERPQQCPLESDSSPGPCPPGIPYLQVETETDWRTRPIPRQTKSGISRTKENAKGVDVDGWSEAYLCVYHKKIHRKTRSFFINCLTLITK